MTIPHADSCVCLSDAARIFGFSPRYFIQWLADNHWIFKRNQSGSWLPHTAHVIKHELILRSVYVPRSDGTTKTVLQTMITPVGLEQIKSILKAT